MSEEEKSPDKADELLRRTAELFAKGDFQGVVDLCTREIEIDPKNINALGERGCARIEMDDLEAAAKDFDILIGICPGNPMAHNIRGLWRSEIEDYMGAIEDYTVVIGIDPDFPDVWHKRAVAKSKTGDPKGALEDYAQAEKLRGTKWEE